MCSDCAFQSGNHTVIRKIPNAAGVLAGAFGWYAIIHGEAAVRYRKHDGMRPANYI